MDIKEIKGVKVLHLIDHFTRYSVASKIKSKESSDILNVVLRCWIAYFGAPSAFLSDNGREFNNENFRDFAQNMNVIVRTTAAESPWSNGLNERHNATLNDMVVKTVEDTRCSVETALPWAISAKNSLHNVSGFSPNQLVFGYNPNVPTILVNQPPALEATTSSEIVARNLNAMHAGRRAFIEAESSEKLRRALRHQIRPSIGQMFNNGDQVYFKRNQSDRWMGPGTVIGSENKQVLVKHGGSYVRVHPCRLQMYSGKLSETLDAEISSVSTSKENETNEDCVKETSCSENDQLMLGTGDYPQEDYVPREEIPSPQSMSVPVQEMNQGLSTRSRGRPPKTTKTADKVSLPKVGEQIFCKLQDENDWKKLSIISKAGKSTGKNRYIMNVSYDKDGDAPFWLDF